MVYWRRLCGRSRGRGRIGGNHTELHARNESLQLRYFGFEPADARLHFLRTLERHRSLASRGRLSARERTACKSCDEDRAFCERATVAEFFADGGAFFAKNCFH